jgi:hypothetical protein
MICGPCETLPKGRCCFCAFSTLVLLTGIALVVAGAIIATTDTDRRVGVYKDYNAAAIDYVNGDGERLKNAIMQVNHEPLKRTAKEIEIFGDMEDVVRIGHWVFADKAVERANLDWYSLDAYVDGTMSSLDIKIPTTAPVTEKFLCTRDRCTRDCLTLEYTCLVASLERECTETYGGAFIAPLRADICRANEPCGICTYTGTLRAACVVVNVVWGRNLAFASKYPSCFYPFTGGHLYGPPAPNSTIEFTVMTDTDPYLRLQELTAGRAELDRTVENRESLGKALVVAGIVSTAVSALALFCLCLCRPRPAPQCNCCSQKRAVAPPAGAAATARASTYKTDEEMVFSCSGSNAVHQAAAAEAAPYANDKLNLNPIAFG